MMIKASRTPEDEIDRHIAVVNVKSLSFNGIRSSIIMKLETSSRQNRAKLNIK